MKRPIEVVGAIIVRDESVLVAQRGPGKALAGLWEFPGGKVEAGESPTDALTREIVEELGCRIKVGEHVTTTTHKYEFGTIELATYYAALTSGTPVASEHAELRWVPLDDLQSLEWAPADLPTVEAIVPGSTE